MGTTAHDVFDGKGPDHDIVDLSKLKGFDNFKDVKAALEKHGHDVWLEVGKDVLVLEDANIKHLGKGDFAF